MFFTKPPDPTNVNQNSNDFVSFLPEELSLLIFSFLSANTLMLVTTLKNHDWHRISLDNILWFNIYRKFLQLKCYNLIIEKLNTRLNINLDTLPYYFPKLYCLLKIQQKNWNFGIGIAITTTIIELTQNYFDHPSPPCSNFWTPMKKFTLLYVVMKYCHTEHIDQNFFDAILASPELDLDLKKTVSFAKERYNDILSNFYNGNISTIIPIHFLYCCFGNNQPLNDISKLIALSTEEQNSIYYFHHPFQRFSPVTSDAFATFLRTNRHLEILSLEQCNLSNQVFTTIVEILQHPKSQLATLNLLHTQLGDLAISHLAETIEKSPGKLSELILSSCLLTNTGMIPITKLITRSNIKYLNLSYNHLTDENIQILAQAFEQPDCSLNGLNLYMNGLGDTGATAVADMLSKTYCTLTYINLGLNNIYSKGVSAIIIACSSPHSKITLLNIESNHFSEENIKEFNELIAQKINLRIEGVEGIAKCNMF